MSLRRSVINSTVTVPWPDGGRFTPSVAVEPGAEHHAWAQQVLGISVDDDTRTEA